jgi:E3 ubiquitin-protein ligase BAH
VVLRQIGSRAPTEPLASSERTAHSIRRIEVPLTFDAEFFELLQGDVSDLGALQEEEKKAMVIDIKALGRELTKVATPSTRKTDLSRWRELFDLYLQAGIFFSTNELDHGSRNSTDATRQLQWFQAEASRKGLVKSFKLSASRRVLERFIGINLTLLHNLRFQEMNQLAISKILKSMSYPCASHKSTLITSFRIRQEDILTCEKYVSEAYSV